MTTTAGCGSCDYLEHLVQFEDSEACVAGAMPAKEFLDVGAAIREKPTKGHVAFFAETTHKFGPVEYGLSTQIRQE